ncbi:ubiquinol-cytochrome C chaperone family protein [Enterovirga aerilata]|nr:ubiquinol-cytochrome C chaperone family protein [Enterovirga sp. DB1703]
MFGFRRKNSGRELVEGLHARVVEASRRPELYVEAGLPDTMEGRFEALTLHALLVLRRLRQLPPPADDVAQELVDAVFAHLEIALREMGIGDFGVPKRMKKLAQAFFDRTAKYDALIASGDAGGLAAEMAGRLGAEPARLRPFADLVLASEARLAVADLDAILAGPPFASASPAAAAEASR